MDWLSTLEGTALATWVRESGSLWGYPLILTLHTVGLAMLVGASTVVDLRLLGASQLPLPPFERLFTVVWLGFAINAASGTLLFMSDATAKGAQLVFWIKLGCIGVGVAVARLMQRRLFAVRGDASTTGAPSGRGLAVTSLLAWLGAITAGRLMAYL
jgi:hypothetical protein